jgi:hypothetical protein
VADGLGWVDCDGKLGAIDPASDDDGATIPEPPVVAAGVVLQAAMAAAARRLSARERNMAA